MNTKKHFSSILGKRFRRNKIEYCIKFEQNSQKKIEWISEENLRKFKSFIREFEDDILKSDKENSNSEKNIEETIEEMNLNPIPINLNSKNIKKSNKNMVIKIKDHKIIFLMNNIKVEINEKVKIQKNLKDQRGHFLYGDIPKKIKSCNKINGQAFVSVEWEKRKDGYKPAETSLSTLDLKNFAMETLVDYYESKLVFPHNKEKNNLEKKISAKIEENKECNTVSKESKFCILIFSLFIL